MKKSYLGVFFLFVFLASCGEETTGSLGYEGEYGSFVDSRDGRVYATIEIGDQEWMAENLNYKLDSSFCYNDSSEYCERNGRLYNWDAALLSCPEGWHLPDTTEWKKLFVAVGGVSIAGKMLKCIKECYEELGYGSYQGYGTDAYGFSAKPVWYRTELGYYEKGEDAVYWSSTESERGAIYEGAYAVYFFREEVGLYAAITKIAFPVRCLRN